jgi:carbamate kinase
MAPKVQEILDYLLHGGTEAIVTDPANLGPAVLARTGTRFNKYKGGLR